METVARKEEIMGRLEDEETYAKSKLECQGGSKGEKVLGVKWNCESDTFHLDLAHIAKRAETRVAPLKEFSIPRLDVSKNTSPTYEHDTKCVTVTANNRWCEILAT